LQEGIIDCVATDHAPHTNEEKSRPFGEAPNGIIGLETAFLVMMTLVEKGLFSLERTIEALSTRPAKIAGLEAGSLAPGKPADIVIFDPKCKRKLTAADLRSKSTNTPMLGEELYGKIYCTIVAGQVKFKEFR
jgi:dihydroorotase